GSVNRVIAWGSARDTEAAMVALTQRLEELARRNPSPGLQAQVEQMQEIATEAGDAAVQSAAETTVIFVAMLAVLTVGFWYNRRRLAIPFGQVLVTLERIAAGSYGERLSEDQPDEFGAIAHGLNLMTAALAWRERMQEYASHLLAALNALSGEGGGLAQALTVVAAATGAAGMVLYQPDYDANTWAPTARRSLDAGIVPRPVM